MIFCWNFHEINQRCVRVFRIFGQIIQDYSPKTYPWSKDVSSDEKLASIFQSFFKNFAINPEIGTSFLKN